MDATRYGLRVTVPATYDVALQRTAEAPMKPWSIIVILLLVVLGGDRLSERTDGELITAIVNPSHGVPQGRRAGLVRSGHLSRMGDFGEAMTVRQLIDIVAFLHSRLSSALAAASVCAMKRVTVSQRRKSGSAAIRHFIPKSPCGEEVWGDRTVRQLLVLVVVGATPRRCSSARGFENQSIAQDHVLSRQVLDSLSASASAETGPDFFHFLRIASFRRNADAVKR